MPVGMFLVFGNKTLVAQVPRISYPLNKGWLLRLCYIGSLVMLAWLQDESIYFYDPDEFSGFYRCFYDYKLLL
jgi:hypothetical protein